MGKKLVLVTHEGGLTTLTLNRPEKRNALNAELIAELSEGLKEAANNAATKVLMILGAGDHFCAGADIASMQKIATNTLAENIKDAQKLADLIYQLYIFPKPTILLAHGATVGGGLGLIAASDIAIASRSASFTFTEVKLGIVPSIVSPYVIAAIGERAARYYFLTGERFFAPDAHRLGLVQQFCADNALASTGISVAETLLKNAPKAMVATKMLLRKLGQGKITEKLVSETAENLATLRATPEAEEGLQAFLEKRDPKWGD